MAVASLRRARRRMKPRGANRFIDGSAILLTTERCGMIPSRLRSSGTRPIPAAIAARVPCLVSFRPLSVIDPGGRPVGAGDQAQEFGAAGADQAGDAEHLAAPKLEGRIDDLGPGGQLVAPTGRSSEVAEE